MSASKYKLIDKANEEAKKPKKARPKRVADPEPVVIPVTIAPTVQPVQPQLTQDQIDALYAQLHANDKPEPVATIAIPEPVVTADDSAQQPATAEPAELPHIQQTPEPDKENVFEVWKRKGYLWWFGCAILFIIALIIYFVVQNNKDKKADKKTEQVQKNIEDQKGELGETEWHMDEMKRHRMIDSNFEAKSADYEQAKIIYETFHAELDKKNAQLLREKNELQSKINAADTIDLRNYGRKDADNASQHSHIP